MNFNDEQLEKLILDGIVEFAGLDNNGEMLYSFSPDLQEKMPELYELVMETHMRDIYELWEKGFLSMDITSDAPLVRITEAALMPEAVETLEPYLRVALEQIVELSRQAEEE